MDDNEDMNNGIFEAKEMALKLKIRNIREGIIDKFVEDGIPTDNRDIRMLNEIMVSVDSEVTETAKLRNASSAQKGDEALKLAILERLTATPSGSSPASVEARKLLEVEVLDSSLKEGEDLNVDDFIAKD